MTTSASRQNSDRRLKISAGKDGTFLVQRGHNKQELTFDQVFSLGHSFFHAGDYQPAHDLFAVLSRIRGRGPRAKIMLARCKAELDSFEKCEEILHTIFRGEQEPIAEEFQAAFVFHTMGLREEAIRELVKLVKEYPDLPSACLFLGDLFQHAGKPDKAAYCWKLAVRRDCSGGAIATTAKKQLARLAKQLKRMKVKAK
jgi:thioredoxin-like negative regulator of GroEL